MQTAVAVSSELAHGHDLSPLLLPGFPFCPRAASWGSCCPSPAPEQRVRLRGKFAQLLEEWSLTGSSPRLSGAHRFPCACLQGWLGFCCKDLLFFRFLPRGPNDSAGVGEHECPQFSPSVGRRLRAFSLSVLWRGTQPHAPLHNISLPFLSFRSPRA